MTEILIKIVPVILLFFAGLLLKLFRIIKGEDADLMLRLVFYVSLPALILKNVGSAHLTLRYAILPLSAALIIGITWLVSRSFLPILRMERKSKGVFLIATLILNTAFLIPFVSAIYGDQGLTALLIFDIANALIIFTFIYLIAIKYSDNGSGKSLMLKKLLVSLPLWALVIAILISIFNLNIGEPLNGFLEMAGSTTTPLLMISLGAFFDPKIIRIRELGLVFLLRFGLGFLLGFGLAHLFGLEGLFRNIVILGAASPVGFNTLTFASLENLDKKFAASLVSFAIILGMLLTPFLMWAIE